MDDNEGDKSMKQKLKEIQLEIAQLMVDSAGSEGPWEKLIAECRSAWRYSDFDCWRVDSAGNRHGVIDPAPGVLDLFDDLREGMANSHGAWFSAVVTIDDAGAFEYSFNYDDEPDWAARPSDETLIEDMQRHPRAESEIPAWHPARQ